MARYQLMRRLEIIVQLLTHYPACSKKKLMRRLREDYELPITARTLERDFKALNSDFGIELIYDREQNGYHLQRQDQERAAAFLKFLSLVHLGELFKKGLQDFDDLQEVVALEDNSRFRGQI